MSGNGLTRERSAFMLPLVEVVDRGAHGQKVLSWTTPAGAGTSREYVLECRCGWDTGPASSYRRTAELHRAHVAARARASPR